MNAQERRNLKTICFLGIVNDGGYLLCRKCANIYEYDSGYIACDSAPHNAECCDICHGPLAALCICKGGVS